MLTFHEYSLECFVKSMLLWSSPIQIGCILIYMFYDPKDPDADFVPKWRLEQIEEEKREKEL